MKLLHKIIVAKKDMEDAHFCIGQAVRKRRILMKSLKDSFCQAITAFICFVINLFSTGNKKREEDVLLTASVCGNSGNLSVNNENNVENFSEHKASTNGKESRSNTNHIEVGKCRKQGTLQKRNVSAKCSTQKELCKIRVPCFEEYGGPPP